MNPMVVWKVIYITTLVGIFLYVAFWVIDTKILASQVGDATVVDKECRKAATTYRTEQVGGTTRVIPYATPEMYILKLRVGSGEALWPVPKEFYDKARVDDQLRVRYEKRRITGSLKIVSIETEVTK